MVDTPPAVLRRWQRKRMAQQAIADLQLHNAHRLMLDEITQAEHDRIRKLIEECARLVLPEERRKRSAEK